MKTVLAMILGAALIALVGCEHYLNEVGRQEKQERREWVEFSIAHHCKVVRPESFWNNSATWGCDGGFEVVRIGR
jgi:hypothetical protein